MTMSRMVFNGSVDNVNKFMQEYSQDTFLHRTTEIIEDVIDCKCTAPIKRGDIREFQIGKYTVIFVIITNVDKGDIPIIAAGISKFKHPAFLDEYKLNDKYVVQFWNTRTMCVNNIISRSRLIDRCSDEEMDVISDISIYHLVRDCELPVDYETRIGTRCDDDNDIRFEYRDQVLHDWNPVDVLDLIECGIIEVKPKKKKRKR